MMANTFLLCLLLMLLLKVDADLKGESVTRTAATYNSLPFLGPLLL